MTRDEIYEHLAKVYLGKRESVSEEKKPKPTNHSWLVINIVITTVIIISMVYGFTAFLTRRAGLKDQVYYSLSNDPIRIAYNLNDPYPATKTFMISLPTKDMSKYRALHLSIRGLDSAYPGVVKLIVRNQENEEAIYYIQNVDEQWRKVSIPLARLDLTDWTTITNVAFELEAWNVDFRKGTVLIDGLSFSN